MKIRANLLDQRRPRSIFRPDLVLAAEEDGLLGFIAATERSTKQLFSHTVEMVKIEWTDIGKIANFQRTPVAGAIDDTNAD
jgi:hypothetical protein